MASIIPVPYSLPVLAVTGVFRCGGVAEGMGSGVIKVEGVEEHAAKALRYSA